jgi:hypothetical protein
MSPTVTHVVQVFRSRVDYPLMKPPPPRGVGPRHARWQDNPNVLYMLAVGSLILLGVLVAGFY